MHDQSHTVAGISVCHLPLVWGWTPDLLMPDLLFFFPAGCAAVLCVFAQGFMRSVLKLGFTTCAHTPKENSKFPHRLSAWIPTRKDFVDFVVCFGIFPDDRGSDVQEKDVSAADSTVVTWICSRGRNRGPRRFGRQMFGFSSSCLSFTLGNTQRKFPASQSRSVQILPPPTWLRFVPLCVQVQNRLDVTNRRATQDKRVNAPCRPTAEHLCLGKCEGDVGFPRRLMGRLAASAL